MRQYAVVALAVFTLSQSAYGADLQVKALGAPAPYDWTGYYVGAHLDYQAGSVSLVGRPSWRPRGRGRARRSERDMISRPAQAVTQ